jgi:uroporphyrinogen decarboxylase
MSDRLRSDIVYVGSGYPNFPVAALGGKIKYRDIGTPDLEAPIVSSEKDLAKLDLARIEKDGVLQTIREAYGIVRAKIGDEYIIALTAWGPFTLAARLMGEEIMMKALYKAPSFVESAVSVASEMLMRFSDSLLSSGMLDVILLCEPTASGDLISRKQFERFVIPRMKEFTGWAKTKGAHTIIHICGNTTDRLDLYPLTGASCISLDHKTDMAKAKELLHGKMCFAGNVDPVKVLLQGTAQDVEDACRRVIQAAGIDGGFILMPGCDIPPTVPFENIQTFMQTAREWK